MDRSAPRSLYLPDAQAAFRLPAHIWQMICRLGSGLPITGQSPSSLPAAITGQITFAAFNRLIKTTPAMIRLWARIMAAVPDSLLAVLVGSGCGADGGIIELFERNGVRKDRLVLIERRSRSDYFKQYSAVDIALDTFPYNGHTTTCDALWMGVPVVSLAGGTHVSRAGLNVLTAVGLGQWVGRTEDQYVELAVQLASNLLLLKELRSSLRRRFEQSVLRDEAGFTRRLEEAYRRMWSMHQGR